MFTPLNVAPCLIGTKPISLGLGQISPECFLQLHPSGWKQGEQIRMKTLRLNKIKHILKGFVCLIDGNQHID
jgi:hypothetical protein